MKSSIQQLMPVVIGLFIVVVLQGLSTVWLTAKFNAQLKASTEAHNAQLTAQAEAHNAQLLQLTERPCPRAFCHASC
jgi:ABC-type phosphate transport system auxiliary subunit